MAIIQEVWKETMLGDRPIKVSNLGRVIGRSGKLLKPQKTKNGYLVIKYWNGKYANSYLVHRLVASAFLDNPNNKPEIDHIDTNRMNNRVENLRWVTRPENYSNPNSAINRSKAQKGKTLSGETRRKMSLSHIGNKNSLGYKWTKEQKEKLIGRKYTPINYTPEIRKKISEARISMAHPVQQYTLEGEFINEFRSSKEASETLNICRRNIDYCISGKQKTCKGFIFKRKGK